LGLAELLSGIHFWLVNDYWLKHQMGLTKYGN
jgi:hypothetical protein